MEITPLKDRIGVPNRTNRACCPCCDNTEMVSFYQLQDVPVHSVLLMPTKDAALSYPKRDIDLVFCANCGFICNTVFDTDIHDYSSRYEETQGYSATFNSFQLRLARYLIDRYDLRDKEIIEIGCGKGEFLTLLCELGNNRGVGFDPAYVDERNNNSSKSQIAFVQDFYSEAYGQYSADFVCCKMTLEHISKPAALVRAIRRSLDVSRDPKVFFQVPNVMRILKDVAFWDIYYEHCSYFSADSLAHLFRANGFDVLELRQDYDDQYLLLVAQLSESNGRHRSMPENDINALQTAVTHFSKNYEQKLRYWRDTIHQVAGNGGRAVLWGGGSKAVAFLTTLDIRDQIKLVVDINPYRQGTFIAGTGQEIVAPEALEEFNPDLVIVMNPVYQSEIQQSLHEMNLNCRVMCV